MLLCPRHSVWLLNSCPACQKPIPGLRPRLCTCPTCGGDYRQRVLPLGPEASWVRSTHRVFLTHLGIDASELGEPSPADELSLLRSLASHEYFSIVTQFLELFYTRSYRERLLPLLLHALPVADLAPPHIQNGFLLLHYVLAYWPVHFWIMLERLQQMLEEDPLWAHSSYTLARQWEAQLTQGAVWDQGASNREMMAFLHAFFDMAKDYFQQHRHSRQSDTSTGKHSVSTPLAVAYQLRPPAQEELVAHQPWEDLTSIIDRVARAMRAEHLDWLLISPDTPHRKVYSREISLLHRLVDYQVFERVLGLDEAEIYSMTLHRFATRLQSPEKGGHTAPSSLGGEMIARPLLSRSTARRIGVSTRHTKLCLDCLEEEPSYDRLFWRLRPVILCPRHSLLLIDRCPTCLAPIPGLRLFPEKCPYCRCDYRLAPRILIAPLSWLHKGQTMLLHLLTAQNVGDWTDVPTFAQSPILRIEPWHYFALLERFKNLLQPNLTSSIVVQALKKLAWEDDLSISESPATREVAMQMALFHYLLASWPTNLLTMIERVARQTEGQQVRGSKLANFWQTDQLVQPLQSLPAYSETPFVFLLQVFEALFTWATISGITSNRGEGFDHE